ncbi:MAG: hypothetical protein ABEL97_11130 [Salinibacter sp.]
MTTRDWTFLARAVSGILLFVAGTVGGAGAQPTVSVRGNVGAAFFRSPEATSTILNSGTNLGLEAEVRVYRGLGITVGASYDNFTFNEDNARIYGRSGGDLSFLGGGVGLRYTFLNDTDAHPYVALGGALYQARVTDRKRITQDRQLVDMNQPARQTEEGGYLAAGALFRLDDTYAVFAEPRYTFYDFGGGVTGALRYFTLRLGLDVQF